MSSSAKAIRQSIESIESIESPSEHVLNEQMLANARKALRAKAKRLKDKDSSNVIVIPCETDTIDSLNLDELIRIAALIQAYPECRIIFNLAHTPINDDVLAVLIKPRASIEEVRVNYEVSDELSAKWHKILGNIPLSAIFKTDKATKITTDGAPTLFASSTRLTKESARQIAPTTTELPINELTQISQALNAITELRQQQTREIKSTLDEATNKLNLITENQAQSKAQKKQQRQEIKTIQKSLNKRIDIEVTRTLPSTPATIDTIKSSIIFSLKYLTQLITAFEKDIENYELWKTQFNELIETIQNTNGSSQVQKVHLLYQRISHLALRFVDFISVETLSLKNAFPDTDDTLINAKFNPIKEPLNTLIEKLPESFSIASAIFNATGASLSNPETQRVTATVFENPNELFARAYKTLIILKRNETNEEAKTKAKDSLNKLHLYLNEYEKIMSTQHAILQNTDISSEKCIGRYSDLYKSLLAFIDQSILLEQNFSLSNEDNQSVLALTLALENSEHYGNTIKNFARNHLNTILKSLNEDDKAEAQTVIFSFISTYITRFSDKIFSPSSQQFWQAEIAKLPGTTSTLLKVNSSTK